MLLRAKALTIQPHQQTDGEGLWFQYWWKRSATQQMKRSQQTSSKKNANFQSRSKDVEFFSVQMSNVCVNLATPMYAQTKQSIKILTVQFLKWDVRPGSACIHFSEVQLSSRHYAIAYRTRVWESKSRVIRRLRKNFFYMRAVIAEWSFLRTWYFFLRRLP